MTTSRIRRFLALFALATASLSLFCPAAGRADGDDHIQALEGRLIAIGIPGISAISPVGTFLPGGPIHDNPALAAFTQPGRVIDPARILVGSTSNFGAPVADPNQLEGSFLSIDPRGTVPLVIPPLFAAAGGQASALGGLVQMYSAQSPAFLNSIKNPLAPTAGFTGVSNPLGISINNAFGRFWPANAPFGLEGIGSSTILDPAGYPLAGAPNPLQIGGVYAGDLTPRMPQLIPGALSTGAVGTAFLGHSPDPKTRARAVFAVVTADGAIVQEHTQSGLDGLAPPGTISPLLGRHREGEDGQERETDGEDGRNTHTSPRLGVLLNYSPARILYVSEPFENSIATVALTDDGVIFRTAGVRRFTSEALDQPVDLAPVLMETSNPNWASNTTLDVQSDFYVANRGNNTIVRMRQDGAVVAVRRVRLAGGKSLGEGRLNGIATSPDGAKIWVTVTGRLPEHGNQGDYVLEFPAF
jgi:hypothetical protein